MSAEILNLAIEQGATFSQIITPLIPVDLSGYTGTGQVRLQADGHYPMLAAFTVTVAVGTVGIFTISMDATMTGTLPVFGPTYADKATFVYDIIMTKAAEKIRVLNGNIIVSPAVTK